MTFPDICPVRASMALELVSQALLHRDHAAERLASIKTEMAVVRGMECIQRSLTACQLASDDLERAEIRFSALSDLLVTMTGGPVETLLQTAKERYKLERSGTLLG